MSIGDPSGLLGVVLGKAAVDGPKVGKILIFAQNELDINVQSIDLGV